MNKRWPMAVSVVLMGLSVALGAPAGAEPSTPGPSTTSSTDDLVDMVLDAIDHQPAAPSTTPVAPPR